MAADVGHGGNRLTGDCDAHPSVSEEFRRFAELLAERAGPWTEQARQATGDGAPCTWCPLCAVIGLLRGERPELAARLAEHGAGLLAVLREAATPAPQEPAANPGPAGSPPPRVQRVVVRRPGDADITGC